MQKESKLYLGDCLEIMPQFETDSIDAIVTDPPYGLSSPNTKNATKGFMNKSWDICPSLDIWRECLRVLKPGAFAFVMSIPRQDCLARMICRLEDAGFNVAFSSIYWTYACLSEDTEILTKEGWVQWHMAESLNSPILIYNYEEDCYIWQIPTKWQHYRIKDTCYRIESSFTKQLVTREHRIAFEQAGKISFGKAEEMGQTVRVPYLDGVFGMSKNIYIPSGARQSSEEAWGGSKILLSEMQWERKSALQSQIQQRAWDRWTKLEREKKRKATAIDGGRKELGMERWSNIFQKAWQLCKCKICTLSKRIFEYGTQRWLCDGTPLISSTRIEKAFMAIRNSASYRSRSNKQQSGQFYAISRQSRAQTARRRKSYKTTLATITKEEYEGIVYCPTVSTGCFVARRNGKIFITGNSGFPKAQNLSKVIDKRAGAEREIVGKDKYANKGRVSKKTSICLGKSESCYISLPATIQAKALEGAYSGFQPKPAVEVVIVAMKPIEEKGYVDQALKNRHGCTWLDDARIPYLSERDKNIREKDVAYRIKNNIPPTKSDINNGVGAFVNANSKGRFPANVLCEDGVLNDGVERKSGAVLTHHKRSGNSNLGKTFKIRDRTGEFADWKSNSGEYSRFFSLDAWFAERIKHLPKEAQKTFPWLIVPKASKSEKNKGCEELEKKESNRTNQNWKCSKCNKYQLSGNGDICKCKNPEWSKPKSSNHHPTCKPLKLMSWLITLASREGDTVLDPFMGSGTTPLAAKMTHRYYKGIELEKEFFGISVKRIDEAQRNMDKFL